MYAHNTRRNYLTLNTNKEQDGATQMCIRDRLKDKDLHGVDVTNSYDHKGLIRAIMQYSCGVTRQGCQSKL